MKKARTDSNDKLSLKNIENYKKIFELSPEAIFITDTKGNIVDVNNRLSEWLGYRPEDRVGKNILKMTYLPEESKKRIKENFTRRMKGEYTPPYENEFISKTGERKVGRVIATPIKDENGKIVGNLAMISDVTESKLAEESLKESEEKWRSLVEYAPNTILIINSEGIIQFINRGGVNIDAKQYIGKSAYKRINPEYRATAMKIVKKVFSNGKSAKYILKTYNEPITGVAWYDVQLAPIKHNGEVGSVMAIATNITKYKEMEETLKKNEKKLSYQNLMLKERNITMVEITRQLKQEKERIAEQIELNFERLILPLLTKIRNKGSKVEKIYVDLLAENIRNITGPFGKKLSVERSGLAKKETEICNMIKNGLNSKQIASLLNISQRTVGLHRYNIRKKLGIANKKINLAVYLKTL